VNVGCGNEPFKDWINLDLSPEARADILWDVTDGLPFPDDSCAFIYSDTFWSISQSKKACGSLQNAVDPCN